jgi:hypothetical protein
VRMRWHDLKHEGTQCRTHDLLSLIK